MARITNPERSASLDVVLPVEVKQRVKRLADKRHVKISDVARAALIEYLEKHDPEKRTA